ncbi:LOW QUALITY PROTEIN: trichodiene oxygenase [Aspergillus lentulus]|nr:LOW QUALITY PROTEIN: trichodiene oxygenase [Aspergillus lentulus]
MNILRQPYASSCNVRFRAWFMLQHPLGQTSSFESFLFAENGLRDRRRRAGKGPKLINRMRSAFECTTYIDLLCGFRAVSLDVLNDYAFDDCYDWLNEENFGVEIFRMLRDIGPTLWFFQEFPSMRDLAIQTPFWLAKLGSKSLSRMMMQETLVYNPVWSRCKRQILKDKEAVEKGDKSSTNSFDQTTQKDTKCPQSSNSVTMPMSSLPPPLIQQVNATTIAAYNVVTNPQIYERLTAELVDGASKYFRTQRQLIWRAGSTLPHIVPSKSTSFRLARARGNVLGCKLYIALGRVFRQFDDLKMQKKARIELLYNGYLSYRLEAYNKTNLDSSVLDSGWVSF